MPFNNSFDVIGDSHLHRLLQAETRFPMEGSVTYWTKRGGGAAFLEETVHSILQRGAAEVSVVFLGGNDIDSWCGMDALVNRFVVALEALVKAGSLVILMDQWPRPGARIGGYQYSQRAATFKGRLEHQLASNHWVWMWDWDKGVSFTTEFFYWDGVHCAACRYKKVARYLGAAAIAAARALNAQFC